MSQRAAKVYRNVDLESAPKSQILERLLDRLHTDLGTARQAITDRRIEAKAAALGHAQAIVVELRAALDHAQAPELCGNLARLYDFVNERGSRHLLQALPALKPSVLRCLGVSFSDASSIPPGVVARD